MSINNVLKSCAVVLFGGIVGYSSVKMMNQPNESNRQLASVTYSKLASEQFAKNLFSVEIVPVKIAATAEETSTIKIRVKALKAFPAGLQYSWVLPSSARLVAGSVQGGLDDFAADQVKEYSVDITGFSKIEQTYLSFEITGQLDGKNIRRDVLASSRPEDSFEYVVQKVEQQRQNASTSSNKDGLQKAHSKKLKSAFEDPNVQF